MHTILIMTMLLTAAHASASEDTRLVEAPITEVVVHVDGARLTRRCEIELPEGRSTLCFKLYEAGDPEREDDRILSSSTRAGTQVLSVRLVELEHTDDADLRADLREQVETARRRVADAGRGVSKSEADLRFFDDLAVQIVRGNENETTPDIDPTNIGDQLDYITERRQMLLEQLNVAEDYLHFRTGELDALLSKLEGTEPPIAMTCAMIEVDSPGGPERIELSWIENRSTWRPEHTIRTSSTSGETAVETHAIIDNLTRTDWEGVKLMLSTGRLAGNTPQNVEPVTIEVIDDDDDEEVTDTTPMLAETTGDQTSGVLVLELDKPTNLGQGRGRLLVKRFLTQCLMIAIARPALGSEAWNLGSIKNAQTVPLLEGPTALYLDGTFIGTPRIETMVPPYGSIELWFGVNTMLEIERTIMERETVKTGLLGGGRLTRTRYRTEIRNLSDREIPLLLEDRIPTSTSDDIEISVKSIAPPLMVGIMDDEGAIPSGLLRWELYVPVAEPGSSDPQQSVEWTINVSHASEVETTPIPE
ncbi:MAG: DUF4139 domain-containing protein [Phycisphaerales bacterium]|nr:DUF4139 domain-containing protein [Phycisphaerales bacterium]